MSRTKEAIRERGSEWQQKWVEGETNGNRGPTLKAMKAETGEKEFDEQSNERRVKGQQGAMA